MVMIFILRVFMFYNPIALMEFRRIIQEEEKICDDVASSLTGDRAALAGALRKFYNADNEDPASPREDASRLRDRIEEYSHTLLIEERITRLEEPAAPAVSMSAVYLVVLMTILAVNYYVV
jgi:beta-lactamase regulating signal transducer with metallopeptidase domain